MKVRIGTDREMIGGERVKWARPENEPIRLTTFPFPLSFISFSLLFLFFLSSLFLFSSFIVIPYPHLLVNNAWLEDRKKGWQRREKAFIRSGSSIIPPSSLYHISSRQSVFMRQLRIGCERMEKERTNLSHPSPRPPSVSCGPIDREERGQGKGMGREKASLYSFHLPSLSIGGFYHL